MKSKKIVAFLLSLALIASTAPTSLARENFPNDLITEKQETSQNSSPYIEGEAIVKFNKNYLSGGIDTPSFEQDFNNSDFQIIDKYVFKSNDNQSRGIALENSNDVDMAFVKSPTLTTQQLVNTLNQRADIEYAEPNYIYHLCTNDKFFDRQWGLSNKKSIDSEIGTDINVEYVWDKGVTGSNDDSVIAVIDSGVDYNHPDLQANMWTDFDNSHGYNFIDNNNNPMDDTAHGTHCAGIIAGVGNNNEGITGVNQTAKIMALKAFNVTGSGKSNDLLGAFSYVAAKKDAGVNIIATSNSWSGSLNSRTLSESINILGRKGIISIFASGNESTNLEIQEQFPSCTNSPYIISVGSITRKNELSYFSNYGSTKVDVTAPGSDILSTIPTKMAQYSPDLIELSGNSSKNILFEDYSGTSNTLNFESNTVKIEIDGNVNYQTGKSLKCSTNKESDENIIISDVINLNQNKPKYLSFSIKLGGNLNNITSIFQPYVKSKENDDWLALNSTEAYVNKEWRSFTYILDNSKINWEKFQLKLDFGKTENDLTFYIDNIGLGTKDSILPYAYFSGTSMATPMITGAYNLLNAYSVKNNKNWSPSELRERIIGGSKKDSQDLVGKSISDGHFDFEKAINDPNPVITSLNVYNNVVAINGNFFGTNGKIKIDGTEYTPTTWREDRITFNIPNEIKNYHEVVVETGTNSGRNTLNFGDSYNGFEELKFLGEDLMPDTLLEYKLASINDKIYIIDGVDTLKMQQSKNIYEYDPNTGLWDLNGELTFEKDSLDSEILCMEASNDGKIYYYSTPAPYGFTEEVKLQLYSYDVNTHKSKKIYEKMLDSEEMIFIKLNLSSLKLIDYNDEIYFLGGTNKAIIIDKNNYESREQEITFDFKIKNTVSDANNTYVLAYNDKNNQYEIYSFDGTNFEKKTTLENLAKNQPSSFAMGMVDGNRIIITGLLDNNNNDTHIYDIEADTWEIYEKIYSNSIENDYTGAVCNNYFYVSTQNSIGECKFKRSNISIKNGWQKTKDNNWKYYENGVAVTGWKGNIPGWNNWFFFDSNGIMQTGWHDDIPGWDGWFYFSESGAMFTGWHNDIPGWDGWFYFSNDGVMYVGTHLIDGVVYFFNNYGVLVE